MTENNKIQMIQASSEDKETVSEILQEVADWLIAKGEKLWAKDELSADKIKSQIDSGMFWLAIIDEQTAGCIRFQNEDKEYWFDVPHEDSAFIHRVAVRRKFSGKNVAKQMIEWAKRKAKSEGKKYLRLDCAKREKLCKLYESFGFEFHSEKERDPYLVVRYQFDLEKLNGS